MYDKYHLYVVKANSMVHLINLHRSNASFDSYTPPQSMLSFCEHVDDNFAM